MIIFFFSFQVLSYAGVSLNHSLLAIQLFWSAEDVLEDSRFHSQFTQVLLRMLSHSSNLIQPAQSPFQVIIQRCFSWVGPNPQFFSQDLTWLFYFPGAILKFISKFDVRMNCHQSYVFLQDLSKKFIVGSTFLIFILECLNNSWWCFSSSFSDFWNEEEFFLQILSVLSEMRSSSLMPSSHNCFRSWEFFSPIRCISGVAFLSRSSIAHHLIIIHP